jgi:hypothetical protein
VAGARREIAQKYAIGETCHYCGKRPGTTLDHIVPKSMGGTLYLWNIQPACQPCNHAKADDWPTCKCDKCQAAILRHLSWADKAAQTFEALAIQRRHTEENIESLYQTIARLRSKLREHDEFVGYLRDLTRDLDTSKVEV